MLFGPKAVSVLFFTCAEIDLLSLSVDEFPTLADYNNMASSTFLLSYFYHRSANPGCDFLSELWKTCFCGILFLNRFAPGTLDFAVHFKELLLTQSVRR